MSMNARHNKFISNFLLKSQLIAFKIVSIQTFVNTLGTKIKSKKIMNENYAQ